MHTFVPDFTASFIDSPTVLFASRVVSLQVAGLAVSRVAVSVWLPSADRIVSDVVVVGVVRDVVVSVLEDSGVLVM